MLIRKNLEVFEEPFIILRADAAVKHGFVVNLLDELRKIENLKLLIQLLKIVSF